MHDLIQLLTIYKNHFSFFDLLATIFGVLFFSLQLHGYSQARGIATTRGADFDKRLNSLVTSLRYGTLAVDGLPLIGLLGTVGALLVTFAGMTSGVNIEEIVPKFVPGLTSTVTGLFWAILNLVVLNLCLIPMYQKIKGRG